MLCRRALRSVVSRRALSSNVCSSSSSSIIISKDDISSSNKNIKMLRTIEKPVSLPDITTNVNNYVTVVEYAKQNQRNGNSVDEEYEASIAALNTLQSNASTIRRSIALNYKNIPLTCTYKYLERSGLSLQQLDKLSFIHVSGTKGKGSTCALTESILRAHGATTGFFSSPHLVAVTERIRINGEPVSKQTFTRTFWQVFNRLKDGREYEKDMPAYFKFLTILSFHIFLEQEVDVVVLEVGIGGELDCTNIIRNTKTVGISSLGLEHTQLLGDTLEEIAWQKAGIIKNHSNVYTSVSQPECLNVIEKRVEEKKAALYIVPDFSKYSHDEKTEAILKNLNNVTQLNGSLAIQLAYDWLNTHRKNLQQAYTPNSTQLSTEVLHGLVNCHWPGRCQILKIENINIHLDGAHTVESMHVCNDWFQRVSEKSHNPKILIFNTTGDRNSKTLLDILRSKNQFDMACFVPNIASGCANHNDNTSVYGLTEQLQRAKMHADIWYRLAQEADEHDNSKFFGSIFDSFRAIRKQYGGEQQVNVLVTGSLHLIGTTMMALHEFKKRMQSSW